MRGTKSFLAVLLVAGLLVGCQSKQNEPIRSSSSSGGTSMAPSGERADQSNMALVRFINAEPNMKTVSAYMDSNQAFADVSFKTVTPYREVPDGRHTFHLGDHASMQAGRDQTGTANEEGGINESESLSSGNYYTVVLLPNDIATGSRNNNANQGSNSDNQRAKIKVIKDDFGSPSKDKAQVRVINAAARVGNLDVVQRPKNDDLFSNIDVGTNPSYKDVDPGTLMLEIRENGKKSALFTVPSTKVDAGHMYTVVIAEKGTNGRNLDAVVVEDQYAQHRDTNQGSSDRDNSSQGGMDHNGSDNTDNSGNR
jgi:hypothetical protein